MLFTVILYPLFFMVWIMGILTIVFGFTYYGLQVTGR